MKILRGAWLSRSREEIKLFKLLFGLHGVKYEENNADFLIVGDVDTPTVEKWLKDHTRRPLVAVLNNVSQNLITYANKILDKDIAHGFRVLCGEMRSIKNTER